MARSRSVAVCLYSGGILYSLSPPPSLPAGSVCFLLAPDLLGQEQVPAGVVWLSGSSNTLAVWMLGVGFTQWFGSGCLRVRMDVRWIGMRKCPV